MGVLNEMKNRGVEDILIACMDGLTGFPEAVRAVYPNTRVQLCMRTKVRVHSDFSPLVRNSTKFVSYKDLKKLCVGLKAIYTAATEAAGRDALEEFGKIWNAKYPMVYQSWDSHWDDRGLCESEVSFSNTRRKFVGPFTPRTRGKRSFP
ncbi:hypothetical protein FACS1894109_19940 [Spirochaetia bacterium]|nr:hypothetical protein FACS1894109_19940 [Spirochaetia bacterium]